MVRAIVFRLFIACRVVSSNRRASHVISWTTYAVLLVAIAFEVVGTSALLACQQFTRPGPRSRSSSATARRWC